MRAFLPKLRFTFSCTAVLGLALAAPSVALAQTAPVIGDHYAARASDTGFAATVNATGGYATSVPLDLPAAHGGLPLPLAVVHGGNRFGAAGLGWDVPLSFIRRETTSAYHRPRSPANGPILTREFVSLMLNGSHIDLVRNLENTAWVGLRGGQQLEVRDVGGGVLELYDGDGRKYVFNSDGGSTGPLDAGNYYLLRDIIGPGGSNVHLAYNFGTQSLGGGSASISIDLASISYNFDATGACAKHQVNLVYEADFGLQSVSILGSTALFRSHWLRAIDVTARSNDCSGAVKSLRAYNFNYQYDPDIGQPRLSGVTMIGQEDTPERNVTLPVATYSYGQFKGAGGKLSYRPTQYIDLPTDFSTAEDGLLGISATTNGHTATTLKGLYDIDGDGRPDLVYGHNASFTVTGGRLWRNAPVFEHPGGIGFGDLGYLNPAPPPAPNKLPVPLPYIGGVNASRTVAGTDSNNNRGLDIGKTVRSTVTTQLIDMNGDGRLDVIRSDVEDGAWVVYLNQPDPTGTNGIAWERRTISTVAIKQSLVDAGLLDLNDIDGVPLSRSFTSKNVHLHNCWALTEFGWVHTQAGYPNNCMLPQGDDSAAANYGTIDDEGETSFVEWRLQDLNGDGYPDFVYNGSKVTAGVQETQPTGSFSVGTIKQSDAIWKADLAGSRAVLALMNVAGVHLENGGTNAFSAPVTLEADSSGGDGGGCGIEKWVPGFAQGALGRSNQVCGIEDVNGDGLADRVRTIDVQPGMLKGRVQLGTGNLVAPFSGPQFLLPGPTAMSQRQLVATTDATGTHYNAPALVCPVGDPTASYAVQRLAGLRDLNGDGIPDYILGTNSIPGVPTSETSWTVAFGTGTGFITTPVPVDLFGLELSLEHVLCQGGRVGNGTDITTAAATVSGLYDLDGDGQPEYVGYDKTFNRLVVFQNQGKTAASSAAGRLVKIDNGYGASTNIAYSSAKDDPFTKHLVPSAEVVVSSVTTTDAANNQLTSSVGYAYGGASQFFDAVQDRWTFPGYERKVSLQLSGAPGAPGDGIAKITDNYSLAAFDPNSNATTRFLRYLKAGRTSDVTTLSGDFSTIDAWWLLLADITTDQRRTAATHLDYSARLLTDGSSTGQFCIDMVYPYDYTASVNYRWASDSHDQCVERGFALQTSVTSWRGSNDTGTTVTGTADVATSDQIVKTGSSITAFDDYGRVTDSTDKGDLADDNSVPNDNLCVHVDYAAPQTTPVRVLNAPKLRTVQDCHGVTLNQKSFEYDGFTGAQAGQVTSGFVTSSTVTRYDMDSHLPLGDIRQFDATFDPTGNLKVLKKIRNDGAVWKTQYSYDPFGLVAIHETSAAVNPDGTVLPAMSTSITPDPVTLQIISSTDPNGTVRGNSFDGFGRVLMSKVTPPSGAEGVLSSISYSGFELVDTNGDGIPDSTSTAGRSIVQKAFTDAVPANNVATAPGRIGTSFLDSLGRTLRTEAQLGSDYSNKTLVVGQRTYDPLSRVNFMADPFLSTDSFATAYGTTYNYNTDGTPHCFTRGSGLQPVNAGLDELNQIFPTCFSHYFNANKEFSSRLDPDSQLTVIKETAFNAVGRVLQTRAFLPGHHGPHGSSPEVDFQRAVFSYDALGHRTSMTRYQDAANQTGAVTTRWHYDSLGQMTMLEEPGVAARTRTFDFWGELTQTQWCDDLSAAPCSTQDRRSIIRYDARGRIIHREDQGTSNAAGTIKDYSYDTGVNNVAPPVTATNTLGRLATAAWPEGKVSLSYDSLGRVTTKVFTDTLATPNKVYVERHDKHDDGSERALHLLLPDNAFKDERVDYTQDSAGRINSVVYNDGTSSQSLFAASGSSPIYDVFGHRTAAQYGATNTYTANYAAAGRRLLTDLKVAWAGGSHSREIAFPSLNGVPAYDPLGRERQRQEVTVGVPDVPDGSDTALLRSYDGLGRLSASQNLQISTNTVQDDRSFAYDPLGNILTQTDASSGNPGSVSLTYQGPDLDRICSIAFATDTPPSPCNVSYDGAGNIVSQPARSTTTGQSSGTRTLLYYPNGQVNTIRDGSSTANITYDAFGKVQRLTLFTLQSDNRQDKHFGAYLKERTESGAAVLNRRIPLPGVAATRHGPAGDWSLPFGDGRSTRTSLDQKNGLLQSLDYKPFGEVTGNTGAAPGTPGYTSEQWNGGDLLAPFGLVHLGSARLYDPVIGRFLSRDPLMSAGNPYAFADNDPINRADPTGLYTTARGDPGIDDSRPPLNPEDRGGVLSMPEPPTDLPEPPSAPEADQPDQSSGSQSAPERNSPNALERGVQVYSGGDAASRALFGGGPDDQLRAAWKEDGKSWGSQLHQAPLPACRGNSICPAHWDVNSPPPPGLGPYFSKFGQNFYHCGGNTLVETGCEGSGLNFFGDVLYGECVFDGDGSCGGKVGDLILPDNPLCGHCAGNADRFNSVGGPWEAIGHLFFDEGGPLIDPQKHARATIWHRVFPNTAPPEWIFIF